MKRFNLYLPIKLIIEVKKILLDQGKSLSQLVRELLNKWLKENK